MIFKKSDYWSKQVIRNYDHLSMLAHRIIYDPTTADAALNYALDEIKKNDWQRLKKFHGNEASFKSFLSVVAIRLFQTYIRTTLKPSRIPKWVQSQGTLWTKVFKLLCNKRYNVTETIEKVCGGLLLPLPCQKEVEKAIAGIVSRFKCCGRYRGQIFSKNVQDLEERAALEDQLSTLTPRDIVEAREEASIMDALLKCLMGEVIPQVGEQVQERFERLRSGLQLNTEQRLLLRLIYVEGLSISEAGRRLQLNDNEVHGRHRRIVKKIRDALNAAGLIEVLQSLCVRSLDK